MNLLKSSSQNLKVFSKIFFKFFIQFLNLNLYLNLHLNILVLISFRFYDILHILYNYITANYFQLFHTQKEIYSFYNSKLHFFDEGYQKDYLSNSRKSRRKSGAV